jgi:ribosomal protein L37AE/L43A
MAEPPHGRDGGASTQPQTPALGDACRQADDDKMICERCGKAEMYRMHAVWRCPECGYKTDCCGW